MPVSKCLIDPCSDVMSQGSPPGKVLSAEEKWRQTDELLLANAQLSEFAHAVAHDLREPLRTICAFTQLLLNHAKLDGEGKEFARLIVEGTTRMSSLIEGLLTSAVHGFDDSYQPLDLAPLVADVLQDLGHAITDSGAIVTVAPLPFVQGSSRHLARVFQNLIANAIKYRAEAPVEIQVAAERLGADWVIKVKDNGIGIAPEHHESIFAPFKRLHGAEIPGAGFGLAVCKKIIEAGGGSIWVESEPGAGATFCFTLAAVGTTAVAGSDLSADKTPGMAAHGVILSARHASQMRLHHDPQEFGVGLAIGYAIAG
ncbi:MAG TPA: ATP-binding protein [Bryobacteraceae bacterium]|nr:ATP-binding protein [Bryobacteraceae bacterium]